jgi:hypothetical protein
MKSRETRVALRNDDKISLEKVASESWRTRWPRRAFFSILTICTYTLIVLVLTESGLRFLGFKPRKASNPRHTPAASMPDDKLGWINRPGTYLSTEAGEVPMTFLADHSRRSWTASSKTEQRAEVLVVGCSFTQGFGVTDEETFSYLLNARYPRLMFHNFGTGGYGTYQSLLRIRQNLTHIDGANIPLVIYGFIDIHMQRNVAVANWVRSLSSTRDQYIVPPHVRLGKGGLEYYGSETISFWPLEDHSALIALLANVVLELRLRRHGPQFGATTALIKQMNQFVLAQHKRFLIVLLNRPPQGLVPFLESERIDYVNCDNPAFDKIPSKFRLGGNGHPNAPQNALWASCIGKSIDQELPTLAKR